MLRQKNDGPAEIWIAQAGMGHEERTGEIVADFHGAVTSINQAMRANVSVR